jgi:hypothetical protein
LTHFTAAFNIKEYGCYDSPISFRLGVKKIKKCGAVAYCKQICVADY